MIKYHCKRCNIDCKTSECPVCKESEEKLAKQESRKVNPKNYKADSRSRLYWCKNCNIPIYDKYCSLCGKKGKYISTDLRPVFPEERLLLEILIDEPFKFKDSSVWNATGNGYIVDGGKIDVLIKDIIKKDPEEVRKKLEKYKDENTYNRFNEFIIKFVQANKQRFNYITTEAEKFINRVSKKYKSDEMFISFSGGKDSTVVRDLVIKTLSKPEIIHIFGNTTLEFPLTIEYMNRFRDTNDRTPILEAKNKEKDFSNMCETLGPPARLMRWCCTIFKTGPISRRINGVFKNKNNILTFYGVRRNESTSRSKYDKDVESPKIAKQRVVSPIIDWYDFDIWLYILSTEIDFNNAYRLGFTRVGCWCCPNNSDWSQYLASIYMPIQYEKWRNFLIKFAKSVGKPDPEKYVDEGWWKARQGGNGVKLSKNVHVSFKPCVVEKNSFNYELNRSISDEFYELFKPFGWINMEMGNKRLGEVYVLDRNNNPIIRIQGRKGDTLLKITLEKYPLNGTRSLRESRLKIECQITKYQMCIGCLACESICKYNAITVKRNMKKFEQDDINSVCNTQYLIDNEKCMRCGECINHFDGGCYVRKVLITRREDQVWKMK